MMGVIMGERLSDLLQSFFTVSFNKVVMADIVCYAA